MSLNESLKKLLADNFALSLKTQNYHWNVEGATFKMLHTLFEEQYDDLAQATDAIAELIRGLGEKAPATLSEYATLTSIKDGDMNATAQKMLMDLMHDQDVISDTLMHCLKLAQDTGDEVTADAMIERLSIHRKNKWFLKSSL